MRKNRHVSDHTDDGIRATIEYLRTEFPGEAIGHSPDTDSDDEHLFYVGPSVQRPMHSLLLKRTVLEQNLPLTLITKLLDQDVARLLLKAGRMPVRAALR